MPPPVRGADAIHPGYGFLSESGDFARVVTGAGLRLGGARPSGHRRHGIEGRRQGADAGGRGAHAAFHHRRRTVDLPDDGELDALGWPLLVKASAGGGGRGMRIVGGPVSLRHAVADAHREAEAAFGDGTVFLERYLNSPRHIEVQVLADSYGDTVALFERECSIQRRHQKIIEEAPSPVVTPALRARLVGGGRCRGPCRRLRQRRNRRVHRR